MLYSTPGFTLLRVNNAGALNFEANDSFSLHAWIKPDLTIGGMDGNPAGNFVGAIDQVVIADHAWNAGEVHDLFMAADEVWQPAALGAVSNLAARSAGAVANSDLEWSLNIPADLEGEYQIDLRSADNLGNQNHASNLWRGVIDTKAPVVLMQANSNGASYFDSAIGARRYAINYTCVAFDDHLDESTFDCPGSESHPVVRSFEADPTMQRLFPDWSVRTGLSIRYTVWQTDTLNNATAGACDLFGHCASAKAPGVALLPPNAYEPLALVISPTADSYHVGTAGTFTITWLADAANRLQEASLTLNGTIVDQVRFEEASAPTSTLRTVVLTETSEGRYTLVAQAFDWNNWFQSTLYPVNITLDQTPPSVSLSTTLLTVSDTYQAASGIVRLQGAASDNLCLSTVQVKVGDQPFVDVNFADGAWSAALHVIGPEGKLLPVTVRAIDCAGRATVVSNDISATLNSGIPPSTTILAGPAGVMGVNSATFHFSGQSAESEVVGYQCRINQQHYAPCSSPWTVEGLGEAVHTFHVRAVDAQGNVDETPATHEWVVDVPSANNAPSAADQTLTTDEDTPVAIRLTGSDSNRDALSYALVNTPTHGELGGVAPSLIYTPTADYAGSDSFQFLSNDGQLDSLPATVTVEVQAVNDAPIAQSQTVTTYVWVGESLYPANCHGWRWRRFNLHGCEFAAEWLCEGRWGDGDL